MIKDLVASYRRAKLQHPNMVLDTYGLKAGLYIKVNPQLSWTQQSDDFPHCHVVVQGKGEMTGTLELQSWFQKADYWSSLVDMNKAVDGKKQVHSNNPFALFVKREVLLGEKAGTASGEMPKHVARYLDATRPEAIMQKWNELLNGKTKKKGVDPLAFFENSAYSDALTYLYGEERERRVQWVADWYGANLDDLLAFVSQVPFKNYFKLFFAFEGELAAELDNETMYQRESALYLVPKVFNSNDYNQIVDGELMGLPSVDMTMNMKKPFLEHTTMRVSVPIRVTLEEALLAKEAAEYLAASTKEENNQSLKRGYDEMFNRSQSSGLQGTFHVYIDSKYNELYDFENVPFPSRVSVDIHAENILQVMTKQGNGRGKENTSDNADSDEPAQQEEWLPVWYESIFTAEQLQTQISRHFFRGRMNKHFLTYEPDVRAKEFTATMVVLFLQSRQAFHDWFYKGVTSSIEGMFMNITRRLIQEQLLYVESWGMREFADAMNLRFSIEKWLKKEGEKCMAGRIAVVMAALREKLEKPNGYADCDNDDEFYYLAGQLARYLTKLSRTQIQKGDMFEPFLRAKTIGQLKKQLQAAYTLYSHEIEHKNSNFYKIFEMVCGYVAQQEIKDDMHDMFFAGLASDRLFYVSKKTSTNEGENNNG